MWRHGGWDMWNQVDPFNAYFGATTCVVINYDDITPASAPPCTWNPNYCCGLPDGGEALHWRHTVADLNVRENGDVLVTGTVQILSYMYYCNTWVPTTVPCGFLCWITCNTCTGCAEEPT